MIHPDLPRKENFQHFSISDRQTDCNRINRKPALAPKPLPRRSQWIEEAINKGFSPQTATKAYELYFNGVSQ